MYISLIWKYIAQKKEKKKIIELPSKTSDTAIYFTQPNNKS